MDKILLANSLITSAKQIILCGEIGIAALFAIGVRVGRVERRKSLEALVRDYSKLAPFFRRLFEKAS